MTTITEQVLEEACNSFMNYLAALNHQQIPLPCVAVPVWERWHQLQQERREKAVQRRVKQYIAENENEESDREKAFLNAYHVWRQNVPGDDLR